MRVAVFTDNDFDKINGVTTTLTAVLTHAPADIRPRIYTASALGSDRPDYLALRSFGVGIPFYREMKMYVPHWRRYLDRVLADGVEVLHLTTPGPLGLVALWVAAQASLPLVGSFHTDLSAYTRLLSGSDRLGSWMQEYMRWMYNRCQRVLVPSEATRRLMVSAKGHSDRIRLWTRGVDTTLFTPARRSNRLRDAWRVSSARLALLYVGRVSKEKGLDLLPPLQEALRARGIEHRLIVTGDGPMRRELAARCPEAVFTGPLGREAVADVFASADVFVFPSRTDTAGNVVLEAQASGLPVVVTDQGGPRENMRPGLSGVICPGTDASTWADQLAVRVLPPDHRLAMARAARDYALSRRWAAGNAAAAGEHSRVGGVHVPLDRVQSFCHAARGTHYRGGKPLPGARPRPHAHAAGGLPRIVAIKTLHLTNAYHPTSGGIRTFYRALLASANDEQRTLRLVVPGPDDSVEEVGTYGRIYFVKARPAPSRLRAILDQEQPDLVEICDKYSLCYLAAMLRKAWMPSVKRPTLVGLSCERTTRARMCSCIPTPANPSGLGRWRPWHRECRWCCRPQAGS